ncbi:DNA primase [Halonatronum saccharophilum]|uniref:DNA primase n=1 Tax=Halonatronum saccharophilum TaxID=150060 RepID=UPI0004861BF2|nr:DNA primase [Halonatronum saccharophilum]
MSNSYSDELIEQVRLSNDIIDLISDYTKLEVGGKSYKGLCPFHEEKTPSFNVNPTEQLYYCFGCGAGGDIFNFVMDIEGLNFVEAVQNLADRAGISVAKNQDEKKLRKKRDEKRELIEIHNLATRFYNYLLVDSDYGEVAKGYLQERGFDSKVMDNFKLGFAPDRWQGLYKFLKNKGYSDGILDKSGLVIPRKKGKGYYDRFRNRVIFTIFNHRGDAIGFGGRIIDEDDYPKYLNSPETIIFDKGKNLYGLNWAKRSIQKSNEAIIVEGYTDLLRAHQLGIENVVASLGTALTNNQAKLLKRYANVVYIAYDSDTAGEKATLRGLDVLKKEGLNVKVITLPEGEDPDDFLKSKGKVAFEELKASSSSLMEFKINKILEESNFKDIDAKVGVVEEIVALLSRLNNQVEIEEYSKVVANKLNIGIDIIKQEINKYKVKGLDEDRKSNSRNNINKIKIEEVKDSRFKLHLKTVDELLRSVLKNPSLIKKFKDELDPVDFIKEEYQELVALIYKSYSDNNKLEVNNLLKIISDDKVKRLLLRLSVQEEDSLSYTEEMIGDEEYINRIKEYQTVMKMDKLNKDIKEAQITGDVDRERELLKEYMNLFRKEVN